jgi:RHS repeat-associated protein
MSNFDQIADNESFNSVTPIESLYPDLTQNTVSNATTDGLNPEPSVSTRIIYWYHPDYVGNVDLVTDLNQEAYEFYLYNPWGESLYHWESGSSSWNSPYRFNSKEFDAETGMHYYGARYHHPKLSVWMSVDPLVKETHKSYIYTGNNPIELLDPDGKKEWPSYEAYKAALGKDALPQSQMWTEGDWLRSERGGEVYSYQGMTYVTPRHENFNKACAINTARLASDQYETLAEREAYYHWANEFFSEKGYEVKWMGAAAATVNTLGSALIPLASIMGASNPEINEFIKAGNKAILDDMIPKINSLVGKGVLTGEDAYNWDAQTLADEQNLIQPYYERLSPESIQKLQKNMERYYGSQWSGDILNPEDRWRFGMKLMGYDVSEKEMPVPTN